jgi:hypothetical protein
MPDRHGRYEPRHRDWLGRERPAPEHRADPRDIRDQEDPLEDYGQADFSQDYGYDPETRSGVRLDPKEEARRRYEEGANADEPERFADEAPPPERRSFGGLFGGGDRTERRESERRSQDRVLWVVATEALQRARGIDERDIKVSVENAIVTLEGTVRSRDEKRRAEAAVETRGVRDVHNFLQIRDRGFF